MCCVANLFFCEMFSVIARLQKLVVHILAKVAKGSVILKIMPTRRQVHSELITASGNISYTTPIMFSLATSSKLTSARLGDPSGVTRVCTRFRMQHCAYTGLHRIIATDEHLIT